MSLTTIPASPLTELPETPPPEENITSPPTKPKRKFKEKKQIIDDVIELKDGPGAKIGRGNNAGLGAPMSKDVSNILTEQHFLPRSSVVMRLLEIRDDPLAHFLPTKVTPDGTFFCVAPPGLAPELADMFLHPVHNALAKKRGLSPEKRGNKRPRIDGSLADEDEIEVARRAGSHAPSARSELGRASMGPEGGLDFGDNTGIGMDDFQMDLGGDFEMAGGEANLARARSKSAAPTDRSRLSTPAPDGVPLEDGDENYADATCPIAMFDVRPSQSQGAEYETEAIHNEGKGYSKNTIKALSIIRKELQPGANEEEREKVMSFRKVSDKVRLIFASAEISLFLIVCIRPRDVLPPRSSSSCSFWELVTAYACLKQRLTKTSRYAPRISFGSVNDMVPCRRPGTARLRQMK
jgi:cohesin complex subunit SCC1